MTRPAAHEAAPASQRSAVSQSAAPGDDEECGRHQPHAVPQEPFQVAVGVLADLSGPP